MSALNPAHTNLASLRYRGDSLDQSGAPVPDEAAVALRTRAKIDSLTNSVRVTRDLFPSIAVAVEEVTDRLGLDQMPEVYVYNSGETQAAGFGMSAGPMLATFSSGLVQLLSPGELMFVIGHEIGHCIFEHGRYPHSGDSSDEIEELNFKALQRAAEISADRIGFLACCSRSDAFKAILKTASGLPDRFLRCDTAAYLDQARELRELGGTESEALATHPMFLTRLRALLWFEMSEPYYNAIERTGKPVLTADKLASHLDKELSASTGFRLARASEETVRRALVWGFLQLFVADNTLSKAEQALLARAVGPDEASKAVDYARQFGPGAVRGKFSSALVGVANLSAATRNALYEDLERYAAHAGGSVAQREAVLEEVNRELNLQRTVTIKSPGSIEALSIHSLKKSGTP